MAGDKFLFNNAGKLQEKVSVQVSAGAANAGNIPALDSTGRLDQSLMPLTPITQKKIVFSKANADLITVGSGQRFLKIPYLMFTEPTHPIPLFTKVYKNGTLMTFGTGWTWGAITVGSNPYLKDNIQIIDLSGTLYSVEYTEWLMQYEPTLKLWDTGPCRNKLIPSRCELNGVFKNIYSFTKNDYFDYTVEYRDTPGLYPQIIRKNFSRYTVLTEFEPNALLAPWWLEVYHSGRKPSGGVNNISPGVNSGMTPYTTGNINTFPHPVNVNGNFYFKLRNHDTNVVTDFSRRALSVRRLGLWKRKLSSLAVDQFMGAYLMPRLV